MQGKLIEAMKDAQTASLSTGHVLRRSRVTRRACSIPEVGYIHFSVKEPK